MAIQINSTTLVDDSRNLTLSTTTASANVSATTLVGDGSGLTGLTVSGGDGLVRANTAVSIDAATYLDPVVGYNWERVVWGITHQVARKSDGSIWSWGSNSYGQLGLGDTQVRLTPTKIGTGTDWAQIVCSAGVTLAIKTNGTLWAWGIHGNASGDGINRSSPVQIGAATNWTYVGSSRTGQRAVGAMNSSGSLWTWGQNQYGRLGALTSATGEVSSMSQVSGTFKQGYLTFTWGRYGGAFVKSDGTLWACGYNAQGQLCNNAANGNGVLVQVSAATDWEHVTTADSQFGYYAKKTTGTLWGWGGCMIPDLGSAARSSVTQIGAATGYGSVKWFLGGGVATVLRSDGTMWCLDHGQYTQLGPNANETIRAGFNNYTVSKSSYVQVTSKKWGLSAPNDHPYVLNGYGPNDPFTGNVSALANTGIIYVNGKAGTVEYPYWGDMSGVDQLGIGYPYSQGTSGLWYYGNIYYKNFSKTQSGQTNFDLSLGSTFILNHDDDIWKITFSNVPATAQVHIIRKRNMYRTDPDWAPNYLYGVQGGNNAGKLDISWPNNITWDRGIPPTEPLTSRDEQLITLTTMNGGINWFGQVDVDLNFEGVSSATWPGARDISTASRYDNTDVGDGFLFLNMGNNDASAGQYGWNETTTKFSSPVLISNSRWKQVCDYGGRIIALKSDGTMWGWGSNTDGALGLGHVLNVSSPTQIFRHRDNWASVQQGSSGTVAVTATGEIWVAGSQYRGALGTGNNISYSSPVQMPIPAGLKGKIKYVHGFSWQTWVMGTDGTVWRTGAAQDESLGYSSPDLSTLTQMSSGTNWMAFVDRHSFRGMWLKSTDGDWYAIGAYGASGIVPDETVSMSVPTLVGSRLTPRRDNIFKNAKWVSVGFRFGWMRDAQDRLWGWGYAPGSWSGVPGRTWGATFMDYYSSPVLLEANTTWKAINAGNQSNFWGIKDNGTAWTWGQNDSYWLGSLGAGTPGINYSSPIQIGTSGRWLQIDSWSYGWSGIKDTPFV